MRWLALCLIVVVVAFAAAGCERPRTPAGSAGGPAVPGTATTEGGKLQVAMMPKLIGIAYFNACQKGAEEAAAELGDVELIYDGPTEAKVDDQIRMIDAWIARRVDAIAVAADDPVALASALQRARSAGIRVITYDADADAARSGREFFVNQASADAIAQALVDEMAKQTGGSGQYAIVTSSLTAPNQNDWMRRMERYRMRAYPQMQVVTVKPSEEDLALASQRTTDILKAYPAVKGVWAISSVAFPGAADAVRKAGRAGQVAVVGLSTPAEMAPYVEQGVVRTVILWNPVDLGYLTVHAARALLKGELKPGATSFTAGRLGAKAIQGDNILLGAPMRFTKENIAQYAF